ncbi:hypothetical protein MKX08_006074 [Trichoderma sp. CBMAI-0020]|nr:hypothetical protein MKX08_006074 [Trichoderma sp. CBMAI-0020]
MEPLDGAPPPIAIVGIGLKLPGGITTTEQYWDLLINKRSTQTQVPGNRYGAHTFESKLGTPGTLKSSYGHYLEGDLEKWDASFFSMSKNEVEKLDPQHRLLLGKRWRGRNIGCYVGVFGEDWLDLYAKDPQHLGTHRILTRGDFALSNRTSYEYDLKGPSMAIRTACPSSLVALHEACQAIYTGECESAIVAGTSLFLSPTMTIALSEQGVLSPTGSCKTFDAKANGYARGEAINAIFIKKLEDAIRDGDPIRGVIRGTATNLDGKTIGITNPNQEAHVALMRRAYQVAKISNISDTAFVECHGTGTQVGDPMETGAVGRVFGSRGTYIGSVKPNIGHGEGASGLSSLIKAVLCLEHETIPPQVNFSSPNPKIKWDKYNLRVPTESTSWPKDRLQRVSIIIDSAKSYISQEEALLDTSLQLLVFSAHQSVFLKERAAAVFNYAKQHHGQLANVAYTLGCRRDSLAQRAFAVYDGVHTPELSPIVKPKGSPRVNFVFTGQCAQWARMGADLLSLYPIFRDTIQAMDAALMKLPHPLEWTIEEELMRPAEESRIQQPEFSQTICTALQIGLVNLLEGWGITPAPVVGHSSGEMGAAYAAGALTLEEAIIIAYYRGQMTQNYGRVGAMAAVGLAAKLSLKSVTLSGDVERLDEIIALIKGDLPEIFARKLRVERAYHSHHMCEIGGMYEKLLEGFVKDKKPCVPFFSSVVEKQIKRSVQLMMHSAVEDAVYLEVGPHAALSGPLRDIFKSVQFSTASTYVPTLNRNENGPKSILSSLGRLYQEAVPVNIAATTVGRTVLTDLPNYAWQHETVYWYESRVSRDWRLRKFLPHGQLGNRILEADDLEPTWRNMLRLDDVPWTRDHKIQDDIVLLAAAYIAMAIEALRQLNGGGEIDASLKQVEIQVYEIITYFRPARLTSKLNSIWYEFSISSFNGASWTKHCVGKVRSGKEISAGSEDVGQQPRQAFTVAIADGLTRQLGQLCVPSLMEATNGRGADLVLNSLSGELLHTSWKCVAPFGKMLEIGKRDFIGRGQLGMEIFESNRSFHGIDMSQMAVERPYMCKEILEQFNKYYKQGSIKPISPMKRFEATDIVEAFRYMQKGQHQKFRSDKTYLLVGGLGGIVKSVSNWMVQNGARYIMYLSRSAGDSDQDKRFIQEIEAQGCAVQAIKGSVTSLQDVYRVVKQAMKPIAGVFLMTMALRALEHCDLDFFTLFSSISYVVGQVGQANYSAANAYLTAFTQFRHQQGLPAGVLNLGVIDDVGYVVENPALFEQFRALSFYTLGENELLDALTYTFSHQHPATSSLDNGFYNPSELAIGLKSTKPLNGGSEDFGQFIKSVHTTPSLLDTPRNVDFLTSQIGLCIYNLMSRDAKNLDLSLSLIQLGVDSLVSIEIRNWWRRTLGVSISALEFMGAGSITNLGKLAAKAMKEAHGAA